MSREVRLGPWGSAEAAFGALVLAVAVVGLSLVVLTTPVAVRTLVRLVRAEEMTGLGRATTIELAEAVRRFVSDEDAPALPEVVAGRPAFDSAAVAHLLDVRAVLLPARAVSLGSALAGAIWLATRRKSVAGRAVTAAAMRWAGGAVLAGGALALAVGASDFDALFTWFHGLFFDPGTWLFAEDALLIQVFPLGFWTAAAASWAALAAGGAVALLVAGRRRRFTSTPLGV